MDILTQSPVVYTSSPRITGTENLADLRAIKLAMVQEAKDLGHLQACALVAVTLGELVPLRGYESWTCYRWQLAGVTVELYSGRGRYLPELQAFEKVTTIAVLTNGRMMVHYRESTAGDVADNWFTPGPWLDVVYSVATRAQEIHEKQAAALQEAQRLALVDLLSNGKAL